MQSTVLEEIKAALWEQAYHPCTQVRWGVAQVMAVKRSKGRLLVLLRGRRRWYPAEAVTIERPRQCPTGACDLEDGPDELVKSVKSEQHNHSPLEKPLHIWSIGMEWSK